LSSGHGHKGEGGVLTGRVAAINGDEISITVDSQGGGAPEEFILTAPARGVFVGDLVRVEYQSDGQGHKIALRVVEVSSRQ